MYSTDPQDKAGNIATTITSIVTAFCPAPEFKQVEHVVNVGNFVKFNFFRFLVSKLQ